MKVEKVQFPDLDFIDHVETVVNNELKLIGCKANLVRSGRIHPVRNLDGRRLDRGIAFLYTLVSVEAFSSTGNGQTFPMGLLNNPYEVFTSIKS